MCINGLTRWIDIQCFVGRGFKGIGMTEELKACAHCFIGWNAMSKILMYEDVEYRKSDKEYAPPNECPRIAFNFCPICGKALKPTEKDAE